MRNNTTYKNEDTSIGQRLAMSFRPFLSPGLESGKDVDEAVMNMGDAIDNQLSIRHSDLKLRIKQLLSTLDYDKLTDYQAKCILLLEKEMK